MKTKLLLIYLAFLVSTFMANVQAQPSKLKPGEGSAGVENAQTTRRMAKQSPEMKRNNRYLRPGPAKRTTLDTNEGKTAYGFRIYDEAEWPYYGIVQFSLDTPGQLNMKFGKEYSVSAGAYAKGRYYVCKTDEDGTATTLLTIDLQNGNETVVADISELPTPKSMAYDYATDNMYLLQWNKLSKISVDDGKASNPVTLEADLIAIACSYDGRLYGILAETSELVEINPSNGKLKTIGKTGIPIENMYQSLAFDYETNTLYWAGYGNESFLATLDLQTGLASRIGTIGNSSEISGLYIPFKLCPGEAPGEVTNLKTEPGKNGELSVVLSWENPLFTYEGNTLNELTEVRVYRDGVLIKTIAPVLSGKPVTCTDQVPASGKRQYKIVPCNSAGEGAPRYNNIYIGQDYPADITGLKVTKNGQAPVLSWNPPASGANGAWFDPASVNYKITRYPDQVVLETAYTGKETYTDSSVRGLDVYSYAIEAYNTIGSSAPVMSPQLTVGNHIIPPYDCSFSSQQQFDLWKAVDNNSDLNTWSYDAWNSYASCFGSYEKDADDWLVSSPVHLEAGKYYKMILELDKAEWMETHENIRVTMGTESDVNKLSTVLADYPDFSAGTKNINLKADKTGEYYFGIQCYSQKESVGCQLKSIRIVPSGMTDLAAVRVVSADSVAPAGYAKPYTVTVENKGIATVTGYTVELRDADGNSLGSKTVGETLASNNTAEVEIGYAADKECTMKIYAKVTAADDTNPANNITPEGRKVTFKETCTVSGKVTDEDNNALTGALVKLNGFRPFLTETTQDGTFEITEVYASEKYELTVLKNGFDAEKQSVTVSGKQVDIPGIRMKYSLNKPVNVTVNKNSTGNMISWTDGVQVQQFRYDNGIVGGAYGPVWDSPSKLVGSVYEQPTRLTGMSWVTDDNSGKHETVNLYVLALGKDGKPTSDVLFSQRNVPNIDTTWGEEEINWNKFTFPYPLEAPYGFFLAVGCDKPFTLFVDDMGQRTDYPFIPLTQYVSEDYTGNNFSPVEETFYPVNFFIRGEGAPVGTNQAARFVKGYKVWKLLSGNEKAPETWEELTSGIQTSSAIQDDKWKNAAQGVYRYAVRTEYQDGRSSEYTFSEEVQKDMVSNVSIQLKTNTAGNETEGARAILKNRDKAKEHLYEAIPDKSGKINFPEVWKGTYDLTVRKDGFDLLETELEIGTGANEYTFGPLTLKESVLAPYNLSLSGQPADPNRTFYWNLFRPVTDDLESHDDFEINSQGKAGWQYLDGDNTFTYGIGDGTVTFPNQNKKMACIIFNPSMTTPPMTGEGYESIQPHSGKKFLAFISSATQLKDNNDFLISPELNFEDDFKFRFYGRTCNVGLQEAEQMRVGYSLTGTQPEDFSWLTGESSIAVPQSWTRYEYQIPAKARYVTINYVSFDLFMLMIDDLFIGYDGPMVRSTGPAQPNPAVRSHKCEIYLDGNKIAETQNNNYTFTNLSGSNRTVGVRTVYSSGSSEIVTIKLDGSSIGETQTDRLQIYQSPAEKKIQIKGTYDRAELYDASGKLLSDNTNTGLIDVSTLAGGIYILRIYSQDGPYTQKISINQ